MKCDQIENLGSNLKTDMSIQIKRKISSPVMIPK